MSRVSFTFRPLDMATWPSDGRRSYKRAAFRSTWAQTMKLLIAELCRIRVGQAVIELDIPSSQIRLDGLPYATARPSSPRVRLSFEHPQVGPLQYPCDTFSSWEDNVRAIAKTLEAQRAMERYGATRRHQQYRGWAQLPGNIQVAFTTRTAAEFIAEVKGVPRNESHFDTAVQMILERPGLWRECYRRVAKKLHPDAGGSTADFQRLQEAKRILDAHHGGRS